MNEVVIQDTGEGIIQGPLVTPLSVQDALNSGPACRALANIEAKMRQNYTDADHDLIRRAELKLQRINHASDPEQCLIELRKLKAFKGRRHQDQSEWAFVSATLATDLSKYPLWAVQLGCERHRKRADLPFFPDTAQEIIDLTTKERRQWAQAQEILKRL